jgi:Golgi apparatus protein 1
MLTDDCKAALADFKADAATNVNKNLPLATACAADAAALCADADPTDAGGVLACLLERRDEIAAPACAEQVFVVARDAAADWRVDPDVRAACEADVPRVCADADPGAGDVLACLRDAAASLDSTVSLECAEQLFRQAVENADDVRLDARLARACARDRHAFCGTVPPGKGRVAACLEAHRLEDGFSAACRTEFEAMMEARALDFRLDPALRAACDADIVATCGYALDEKDTVPDDDPIVTACLQDHRDELTSADCRAAVRAVIARASADARFDVGSEDADPLADACAGDRARHCADVPPGSARVVRCLQDARARLAPACAASLFDAEVRAAESIDFKLPLARACGAEAARACAGVPHEGGAMVACLREHAADGSVATSAACAAELADDAARAARDYRLNYRLKTACEADVASLCAGACVRASDGSCGGRVLACLADKQDAIQAKACATEVFYFVKMQVSDYRNDVLLAEACRADVDRHCGRSKPGTREREGGEGREKTRRHPPSPPLPSPTTPPPLSLFPPQQATSSPASAPTAKRWTRPAAARSCACPSSSRATRACSPPSRPRAAPKWPRTAAACPPGGGASSPAWRGTWGAPTLGPTARPP